jgi:hypothetical protein
MDVWGGDETLIREWIEGEQIVLDNVPLRVAGGVSYQLSNTYGRKQQQGEPGPDDHQFNSTHTQRTWVSGQLVRDLQENADVGKYWRGHAWTQTRGALGHALRVWKIPLPPGAPSGPVTPLGRMDDEMLWAVGLLDGRIYRGIEETHTMDDPDVGPIQFHGTVMNTAQTFRVVADGDDIPNVWMYIPTTAGYTRLSPAFEVAYCPETYQFATVGFALNENKIYRLSVSGQVWFTTDHDDVWTLVGAVSDGSEPRQIYQTYDDDNNRTVGISTSSGLWLLDHDNRMLMNTDLTFPEHVWQGYGATNWRGDDFISVGIGIHRKVGTLVTPAGLDDADGLPPPFADGLIVDLAPSYNLLIAALAGEEIGEAEPLFADHEAFHLSQGLPYPIVGKGTNARVLGNNRMGAIYCWNGFGWAELATFNRPPTRAMVTMVRNAETRQRHQHLFWGDTDGGAYTIHIPSTYYNPIQSPNLPLDRTSDLEESRIDWGFPDVPKIAKQINIKPINLWHQPGGANTPVYFNEIDLVCHWIDLFGTEHSSLENPDPTGPWPFSDGTRLLNTLTLAARDFRGNVRRAYPIGWERYRNTGVLLATGLPHEAIWMSYRFRGDVDAETEHREVYDRTGGVIQWRTIIGRKWMRPNRIWTFTIDATAGLKGLSEQAVLDFLDSVCLKKGGVPLVTGDQFYIVDVTRLEGTGDPGLSPRGTRMVTCLEFTDITYENPPGGAS